MWEGFDSYIFSSDKLKPQTRAASPETVKSMQHLHWVMQKKNKVEVDMISNDASLDNEQGNTWTGGKALVHNIFGKTEDFPGNSFK